MCLNNVIKQNKNIYVLYKWQPYNKINGTLYYCFEYFIQLRLLYKNVQLVIVDKDVEKDIKLITETFKDKYKEEYCKFIDNFLFFIEITSVYKLDQKHLDNHFLMLDVFTFNSLGNFITNNKKFVYINNNHRDEPNKKLKDHTLYINNTTFFGYYNYQNIHQRQEKTLLKLGLDFQKETKNNKADDKIFINVDHEFVQKKFLRLTTLSKSKLLYKDKLNIYKNLFDKISTVIYVHTSLDTNNRIIPEGFYHNKKVEVIDLDPELHDSIQHRYKLCKDGKLNELILAEDDIIIQKILN